MSAKDRIASDRSLSHLAELIKKAGVQLKPQDELNAEPVVQKSQDPEPLVAVTDSEPSDEETFNEAMTDVNRVCWRHDLHPNSQPVTSLFIDNSEIEERRLMQAAMDGNWPMTILDHPEYIEGWIGVAGKRFLPKLRNGLYSIQGQIDLHGLNRVDAQTAVEEYIIRMSRDRSCCIKIIHGRGINSPTDKATLKESLQRLLSTRRMSRYVVAYASAPSCDGGVGAVYVLLRRH